MASVSVQAITLADFKYAIQIEDKQLSIAKYMTEVVILGNGKRFCIPDGEAGIAIKKIMPRMISYPGEQQIPLIFVMNVLLEENYPCKK